MTVDPRARLVLKAWVAVKRAERRDAANLLAGRFVPREVPEAMQALSDAMDAFKKWVEL